MVTNFQRAYVSEPFRWKLFLLVVFIMGTVTAAAIVLTLMANPPAGSLHIPAIRPII